jgi:hypothetical protein
MLHSTCGCKTYRFDRHIPNSPKEKNKMSHNPCLLKIVVFWAFKNLLSPSSTGKKNYIVSLKCYDLTNGKE